MFPADNKQLLREAFDAWATGDIRPLLAAMADDVKWTVSGHNSWAGSFLGKDAVRRDLLAPLGARFADEYTCTASRFVAEEDTVVVEAQGRVTTKAGPRYDNPLRADIPPTARARRSGRANRGETGCRTARCPGGTRRRRRRCRSG